MMVLALATNLLQWFQDQLASIFTRHCYCRAIYLQTRKQTSRQTYISCNTEPSICIVMWSWKNPRTDLSACDEEITTAGRHRHGARQHEACSSFRKHPGGTWSTAAHHPWPRVSHVRRNSVPFTYKVVADVIFVVNAFWFEHHFLYVLEGSFAAVVHFNARLVGFDCVLHHTVANIFLVPARNLSEIEGGGGGGKGGGGVGGV